MTSYEFGKFLNSNYVSITANANFCKTLGTLGEYRGGGELGLKHYEYWVRDRQMIEKAERCGRRLTKPEICDTVIRDACVLGIGFKRERFRNSSFIPSVAFRNYRRFRDEFAYYWKCEAPRGRKLSMITLHLAPKLIPNGAPLREIISDSKRFLSARLGRKDVKEFMERNSVELEYSRSESIVRYQEEAVFPHLHLLISSPRRRHGAHRFAELMKPVMPDVHDRLRAKYPDVFTEEPAGRAYVHQSYVKDLNALTIYTAKPFEINPAAMSDSFFRWFFDEHQRAKVFQRYGGFREWFSAHNKSGNRVEKIGDDYRLIQKVRAKEFGKVIEGAEGEDVEDAEEPRQAEHGQISMCRSERAFPQSDRTLSGRRKPLSEPMNVLVGVTTPRPDPAGRMTSFMVIHNDSSNYGINFNEDEPNMCRLHAMQAFCRQVWLRNHCGIQDPDEKDFDVKEYLRPVAERIYARMTHPDPEYRATIVFSREVERVIYELISENRGVEIQKDGTPSPF